LTSDYNRMAQQTMPVKTPFWVGCQWVNLQAGRELHVNF